jgi:tetratricopeptide (TPR) repeat protein
MIRFSAKPPFSEVVSNVVFALLATTPLAVAQSERPAAEALRELEARGGQERGEDYRRSKAKWPDAAKEIDEAILRQDAALKTGGPDADAALKLFSNRAEVKGGPTDLYLLGRLLGMLGRLEEAQSTFESCVRADPFFPWAYYGLGTCHARNERYEDAVRAYRRALDLDPDFDKASEPLAGCLIQLGRVAESEEILKKAIEKGPTQIQALLTLAKLQATRLRYGDAVDNLKKVLAQRPGDDEATRVLGHCYAKAEMWDDAIRTYGEILAKRPDDYQAHKALVRVHLRRGENLLAREHIEAALKTISDPAIPESKELRGLLEELKNRPDVEKRKPGKTPQEWMEILLKSSEPDRCEEAFRILAEAPLERLDDDTLLELHRTFLNALRLKHAPRVRALALRQLIRSPLHDPKDLVKLVALFVDDPDPYVRGMAVYFLGETRTPEAVPHVMKALEDKSDYVFECVHDALFKLTTAYVPARLPPLEDVAARAAVRKSWKDWYEAEIDRYRRFLDK